MFVGVCAVWSVCYIYVTTVCQSRLRLDAVSDYNWRLSIAKCARFGSLLGGVLLHESGILTKKTNESNFSVYFLEKEQEKRRCNNHPARRSRLMILSYQESEIIRVVVVLRPGLWG